jgi:hypothetical protein
MVDRRHGVCGVPEQVQDNLLKLETIPCDRREIVGELRLNDHTLSLKLVR